MKRRWMVLGMLAVLVVGVIPGPRAQAQGRVDPVAALLEKLTLEVREIATRCNRQNTRLVREAKAKIEELKGTRQGRLRIRHIIYTTSRRIRNHSHQCAKRIQEVCSQYIMALEDLADAGASVPEEAFGEAEEICRRAIHRIRTHTQYLLDRLAPDRDAPQSDGAA